MKRNLTLVAAILACLCIAPMTHAANVVLYDDNFNDGTDDFPSHVATGGILDYASAGDYAVNKFAVPAGVTEVWFEVDVRWRTNGSSDSYFTLDDNSNINTGFQAVGGMQGNQWQASVNGVASNINTGLTSSATDRWDRFRMVYDFGNNQYTILWDDNRDNSGFVAVNGPLALNPGVVTAQNLNDIFIWGLDGGAGAGDNLVVTAIGVTDVPAAAFKLGLDFDDATPNTQPGFNSATGPGAYSANGITATVAASGTPIVTERAFNNLNSSGANNLIDGTMIGNIAMDHMFQAGAGANYTITLSGLINGTTYGSDLWFSDVLQGPGAVFQRVEFSDNGGSSWTTLAAAVDPAGLNATPVTHTDIFNTGETWVYRITENNSFDQNRLNAFAIGVVAEAIVPAPAALPAGLALIGLTMLRRRRTA